MKEIYWIGDDRDDEVDKFDFQILLLVLDIRHIRYEYFDREQRIIPNDWLSEVQI